MNNLMESLSKASANTSLAVRKNSPTILFGVGAVSFIGAIVSACTATVKAVDVAEEHKQVIDAVKNEELPEEETKKEVTKVYLHTAGQMAKLYAPTVILSITSLGTMFASNKILKERNAAIASAYTALNAAYSKYRKAVVDKYGEEEDYRLAHGLKEETIEEKYIDDKGKEKTRKVKATVGDTTAEDLYTRYYTKANPYWHGVDDLDEFEFRTRENLLNDYLYRKKFITLNEAFELFGFSTTEYGMVCGWRYDETDPSGDNHIYIKRRKVRVLNEQGVYEDAWLLDFNCDGNIYNYMVDKKTRALVRKEK